MSVENLTCKKLVLYSKVETILLERYVEASLKEGFEQKFRDAISSRAPFSGSFYIDTICKNLDLDDEIIAMEKAFDKQFLEVHPVKEEDLDQFPNVCTMFHAALDYDVEPEWRDLAETYVREKEQSHIDFLIKHNVPKFNWANEICRSASHAIVDNPNNNSGDADVSILNDVGVDTVIRSFPLNI